MNPNWDELVTWHWYGSEIDHQRRQLTNVYKLKYKLEDDFDSVLQWNLQRLGRLARETSVLDASGKEQFRILRQRRMPYSKCLLLSGHERLWTLTTLSIVRHRHELQFANGSVWKFKTPFFSVGVTALENNNVVVAGEIMKSEYRWIFAITPSVDSSLTAIAVALLHEHRFGA
ncbi:MAG: hypothetical protein JNK38_10275 [Acidobacteria bacterium]|nr:hypothetical protein [Acidobacteriota bacterium]